MDAYAAMLAAGRAANMTPDPRWTPMPISSADIDTESVPHQAAGAGILYDTVTQLPGHSAVVVQNLWEEKTSNEIIDVYAGSLRDEPQQGALVVVTWDSDRVEWLGTATYAVPGQHGVAQISGGVAETLTLRSADGTTVSFDVAARAFH